MLLCTLETTQERSTPSGESQVVNSGGFDGWHGVLKYVTSYDIAWLALELASASLVLGL